VGAALTGEAFAYAAREHAAGRPLTHNERLLLLFMAHTALDADKPPRYFGSRERSAVALGRMVPDEPAVDHPERSERQRERHNAFSAVKTATRGLVQRGAIERLHSGRAGRRAEFALRFHGGLARGAPDLPLSGAVNTLHGGMADLPPGGGFNMPPRKELGTNEDQGGGVPMGRLRRAA
jgi:hypothetical protein